MKQLDADEVGDWLVGYIADFVDLPVAQVTPVASFSDLGLDSADAVIVGGAFEEQFDVETDATLFLRNENIATLIADLRSIGMVG